MSFDRNKYIDSVITEAVEFLAERFECASCGAEVSRWELPAHVRRPPGADSPEDLCMFCWAEWAADVWGKSIRE